jgi:hypothetical protein
MPPSILSRLKMTSISQKGGKTPNQGRKVAASSRRSDSEVTSSSASAPLTAEPAIPNVHGRRATHRIDTKGSVQALVVDNDLVIAGLQDGTLAVSFHFSLALIWG